MKPFLWIDAFTETRFGGNPCAVVFDAADIAEADRIAFTVETGLVECAFVVPSAVADFGARYYMPTGEIRMAGHPTVATVTALVEAGLVDLSAGRAAFTLEVGIGPIGIEVEAREGAPPLVTMTQIRPEFGPRLPAEEVAAVYGLSAADVIGAPQVVSTGSPFLVTRLASLDALRAARLDEGRMAALRDAAGGAFMEPYLCVTAGATAAGDSFGRLLLPAPFPPEDPFTGSATGCMAAYLYATGAMPAAFAHEQGHWMGRPGRAAVQVLGPRDDIAGVKVGGSGVVAFRGEVDL